MAIPATGTDPTLTGGNIQLKVDFEVKAKELCSPKTYSTLDKKIEILDIDETPAYGLETKLKIGISGVIECI